MAESQRAPYNWEAFLEGCSSCVLYCHGGCPDGLGAARLACLALQRLGRRSEIIELEHTDRASKAVDLVTPEVAVLYVDISPYSEDLPLLRLARRVVVVDHHASVRDRMAELVLEMPALVDLSESEADHCAASLVGREMGHLLQGVADIEMKIALLRKKDVWHYTVPPEWAEEAKAFVAYMQTQPVATMAMIDEFLWDLPACLVKGAQAMEVLQRRAAQLFEQAHVVAEADHPVDLLVLGVDMRQEVAYDTRHFDKLCRRHANALVLRASLHKSPETVDIRLSRTSDDIPALGALARQLHEAEPEVYVGGGGHPFAAGLQVARAGYDIGRVARDLLHAAGAVPAQIARSRRQDALDVAQVPAASSSQRPGASPVSPLLSAPPLTPQRKQRCKTSLDPREPSMALSPSLFKRGSCVRSFSAPSPACACGDRHETEIDFDDRPEPAKGPTEGVLESLPNPSATTVSPPRSPPRSHRRGKTTS